MNLFTVQQAAERLAISPSLFYQEVSKGKIRYYRLGRNALRFSEEQIMEYLSNCMVEARREPGARMPLPKLRHLRL